jgi:hypothetical protein
VVSATKDPVKARAGTIGARARWGPPRTLRLDALDPGDARHHPRDLTARENAAKAAAGTSGQE